jgi:hypothetical protein
VREEDPYLFYKVKVKVKLTLYRPEQALRTPGGSGSQNF